MNAQTQAFLIPGAVGQLECALDLPDPEQFAAPRGLALVAHPHPLYGGTMDNKVAQTLARSFLALGYATVRMNFRGVGKSEGVHDHGNGETDDMALLLAHMRTQYPDLPLALGGFSFGTFVQAQLQQRLIAAGTPAERLALVGTAAGKWPMPQVPADTILIHGELDDTIPLTAVLDWARPQELPVIVIPGADHFFHRKLQHIKNLIVQLWHR
ncbi:MULTISPECIES: alpha/beta hydrolase [unclassified Herbaspirillum]|uniref:alpha/beta hydrolase n=1 Tax=unclassified Herbaspirillum TaxID=2624150 RepID=UPI000E2EA9AD|nr:MULTISPECIES: alpha/beta hydrolase [unclassified Herbaspirillum]RFB71048.1 alpha/beta hydrolase [Herbaspirillum sp. 3R-3a1]TFI08430.1 alpha/beta hydrolase [Herbaspirillum sp. 3R11]TFI14845.1 alpha/beta hydrolase [Herbaspirillum sp. 3R-11]TFI30312.1 alpha/beta hydrolase [Herbaspirillum sp. 3C11]